MKIERKHRVYRQVDTMNSFQETMKEFDKIDFATQMSVVKNKYHIRVQQRNGRKCVTTLDGLEEDLDLKRICRAMRETFSCNGNVKMIDEDTGVIQLQGDQRENVKKWLLDMEIILKNETDRIVVHGF
jgi:translation initiation factor 1